MDLLAVFKAKSTRRKKLEAAEKELTEETALSTTMRDQLEERRKELLAVTIKKALKK